MASSSKKRTTMAKLNRERALIERRQEKAAREGRPEARGGFAAGGERGTAGRAAEPQRSS